MGKNQNLYIDKNVPFQLRTALQTANQQAAAVKDEKYDPDLAYKDYPHRISKYFKLKYLEDYYTPAYISIFFNGLFISDAVFLEYVFKDTKLPVYGFGDRFISSFEEGHYLVSGRFGILFKEVGFLPVILDIANGDRAWLKVPGLMGGLVQKVDSYLQERLTENSTQFTTLYNMVLGRLSRIMGVDEETFGKWLKNVNDSGDRIRAATRLLQLYKSVLSISLDEKFSNYKEDFFSPYMGMYKNKGIVVREGMPVKYDAFMSSAGSASTPVSPMFWKSEQTIAHQISTRIDLEELFTETSIEGIFEVIEDAIWGYGYDDYPGLPPIMDHDNGDDRPILDSFDIIIRYGEEGSTYTDHTVQVINNVHITSNSQSINVGSPDDIVDVYEFFAENMNQKIVSKNENKYIEIEMAKTGTGYVDSVNSSFFDQGGNFFNEEKNILVRFDKPWIFDFNLGNGLFTTRVEMMIPQVLLIVTDPNKTPDKTEKLSLLYIATESPSFYWGPFYFPHEVHIRSARDTMSLFYHRLNEILLGMSTPFFSEIVQPTFDWLLKTEFYDVNIQNNDDAKDHILGLFRDRFIYSDGVLDIHPITYYCEEPHDFFSDCDDSECYSFSNILHVSPNKLSHYNVIKYQTAVLKVTVPCEDYQYRTLTNLGIVFKRDLYRGKP